MSLARSYQNCASPRSNAPAASQPRTSPLTIFICLYLRAVAQSHRFTEEGFAEAVVLARQALAIDPSYAPAAALVGRCRGLQRIQGWGALSDQDIGEACRLARQALEAERDDANRSSSRSKLTNQLS